MVRTVTTRDPEWDDYERAKMLALDVYEAEMCACGVHKSLSRDQRNVFTLEGEHCPLCASLALQERQLDAEDEKATKQAKGQPSKPLPSDGRKVYLRQLSDDEIAARRAAVRD